MVLYRVVVLVRGPVRHPTSEARQTFKSALLRAGTTQVLVPWGFSNFPRAGGEVEFEDLWGFRNHARFDAFDFWILGPSTGTPTPKSFDSAERAAWFWCYTRLGWVSDKNFT